MMSWSSLPGGRIVSGGNARTIGKNAHERRVVNKFRYRELSSSGKSERTALREFRVSDVRQLYVSVFLLDREQP